MATSSRRATMSTSSSLERWTILTAYSCLGEFLCVATLTVEKAPSPSLEWIILLCLERKRGRVHE